MTKPLVVIFHQPMLDGEPPLSAMLREARELIADHHKRLFLRAGAGRVLLAGRDVESEGEDATFGERLARLVDVERPSGGLVVLSAGAVPLLRRGDASRLVRAASGGSSALTNNRYSSDVCAVPDASLLRGLPSLPTDNALPRWLEERAGVPVRELRGRQRLGLDLDSPLDICLAALHPGVPEPLAAFATDRELAVPRLGQLRELAGDPHRELLVLGRSGSRTLRWLERNVRCRVRFLAEERGLKASSPLAIAEDEPGPSRRPRSAIGRLLDVRGPGATALSMAELADGAIVDSRVLLADRLGPDESSWPRAEDRFASDLLRVDEIEDPWLRTMTVSAAGAAIPILLGGHTLVGPGIRLVLGAHRGRGR
jgi:hypothetical protein